MCTALTWCEIVLMLLSSFWFGDLMWISQFCRLIISCCVMGRDGAKCWMLKVMGKSQGLLRIRVCFSGRKSKESEGDLPWLILCCIAAWQLSMMKGCISFSLNVEAVGLFVMRSWRHGLELFRFNDLIGALQFIQRMCALVVHCGQKRQKYQMASALIAKLLLQGYDTCLVKMWRLSLLIWALQIPVMAIPPAGLISACNFFVKDIVETMEGIAQPVQLLVGSCVADPGEIGLVWCGLLL